jgi:hypothetical protein
METAKSSRGELENAMEFTDSSEFLRVKASSTDEGAIHIWLLHDVDNIG